MEIKDAANPFREKIEQLRANIYSALAPLVVSDYVLLDCPYHSNIGDILIWRGEQAFLDSLPFRCLHQSSRHTFDRRIGIRPADTILLHGGGNFGDLWNGHQRFRLEVIALYPDNPIVVMPQTVHYRDRSLMARDAEIMARHRNLTICARDSVSYALLKENFRNNIVLVPDMAFCIDEQELRRWELPVSRGGVYVERRDQELAADAADRASAGYYGAEKRDWPTFERRDCRTLLLMGMLRVVRLARKSRLTRPIARLFSRLADRYARRRYVGCMVKTGVRFLSPYQKVYTTRLHAGILSILLGRPCRFIDNSYGKNSSFYDTWLSDTDGVELER